MSGINITGFTTAGAISNIVFLSTGGVVAPVCVYVAENGTTFYVAEDGSTFYIPSSYLKYVFNDTCNSMYLPTLAAWPLSPQVVP